LGPFRLSALFGVSDLLLTYRLLFGNTFRAPSSDGVRNGPPMRNADREPLDDLYARELDLVAFTFFDRLVDFELLDSPEAGRSPFVFCCPYPTAAEISMKKRLIHMIRRKWLRIGLI
jgi:hypothetical protein